MYSKLVRFLKVSLPIFLVSSFFVSIAHASTWTEAGDAGDLLATAQIPTGSVTTITGTASTTTDLDLYKIFISDPTGFSAYVSGGDGSGDYDSAIALFDQNGVGVYANDDATGDNGQAGLPVDNSFGPRTSGIYYLAIFDDNTWPTSGNVSTEDHFIFPESTYPYTQILGPTGGGGAAPLTGWFSFGAPITLNESYSIALTGVSAVPEPAVYVLLLGGLALISFIVQVKRTTT
jgi:hypothetical protein